MDKKVNDFYADSLHDFVSIINGIKNDYPENLLVFRGQTKNWPFKSSTRRKLAVCPKNLIQTEEWYKFGEVILRKYNVSIDYQKKRDYSLIAAMNQHYGWISNYLDVTLDPLVALFFATCKISQKKISFICEDALENPYLCPISNCDCSQNPSTSGYVFVLLIEDEWRESDRSYFVNLTELIPESAKRVHNQSAALLEDTKYLSNNGGISKNINDMVCAVIKIDPAKMFDEISGIITFKFLFPSLKEDEFYQQYVMIPRFVFPVSNFMPVAHHVLIFPSTVLKVAIIDQ